MSLCYVLSSSTNKPQGEGLQGRLEKAETLLASPKEEKP